MIKKCLGFIDTEEVKSTKQASGLETTDGITGGVEDGMGSAQLCEHERQTPEAEALERVSVLAGGLKPRG